MTEPADDVTRRTRLAAERTWLAWWRSGIAAVTAAVAVGGVVPELVEDGRTAYVLLGAGYAALAAGVFAVGAQRRRQVDRALERGEYERVRDGTVLVLTVAGIALALATFAVIVTQA